MWKKVRLQVLLLVSVTAWLPVLTKIVVAKGLEAQQASIGTASREQLERDAMYRLKYTVREVENENPLFARSAEMLVHSGQKGKLRIGIRAPLATGYRDVSVTIDSTLRERANDWLLYTGLESFGGVAPQQTEAEAGGGVAYGGLRCSVESSVLPGHPTLITTIDDASRNRRYEIEVVATKVK